MAGNFIKLDRRILEWQWYGEPNTRAVFIHCLLRANWKDGKWNGYEYKRGQFITSLSNLATDLKLSIQQTRTALAHLESTGELTSWSDNKVRIITVNNYDKYQSVNKQNNRQSTSKQQSKQHADNKQSNNSTRNIKKDTTYLKENKEGASADFRPSGDDLPRAVDDYMDNYYANR